MQSEVVNNAKLKSESPAVKRLWLISFLGVIVLAGLALVGWVLGWRLLASFLSYYIPMAPSTATCFIVLALSGFFQPDEVSSRIRVVACVCGILVVMTFGALELVPFWHQRALEVEEFIYAQPELLKGVPVARMSPVTAGLFVLSSAAMLFGLIRSTVPAGRHSWGHLSGLLGTATAFSGFTILLGYLYGAPFLYGRNIIPVAATTALAFLLLGFGVMGRLKPDDIPHRYFRGSPIYRGLVSTFVPLVFFAVLLPGIVRAVAPLLVKMNEVLLTAVLAGVISIIAVVATSKASSRVGDSIDRANEALRESEERFRAMFQNHHAVMLIIDPDTARIEDASPGACDFYGYSREVLTQMKISEINNLSAEQVFEDMQAARAKQTRFFQFRHRLANGEVRDVEACSGPISVGGRTLLFSVINDVTERKQAEEALRASEERYRIVADFTYDCEYWIGPEKRLLYMSPSCERVAGYSSEEFLKNSGLLDNIIHADDRGLVADHTKRDVTEAEPVAHSIDFRIIRSDGEIRWLNHVCQAVYGDNGTPLGRRVSLRDITQRKQFEEEQERLVAQLQEALANVKLLGGMLPICSSCKKIRNDKGYWEQIEAYIRDHSEAEFTHSICPECVKKLYPELYGHADESAHTRSE